MTKQCVGGATSPQSNLWAYGNYRIYRWTNCDPSGTPLYWYVAHGEGVGIAPNPINTRYPVTGKGFYSQPTDVAGTGGYIDEYKNFHSQCSLSNTTSPLVVSHKVSIGKIPRDVVIFVCGKTHLPLPKA
jgi:hypothetical protein